MTRDEHSVASSGVALNTLETWILENAVEDEGFVAQLPSVVERLRDPSDPAPGLDSKNLAKSAVLRLIDLGLIELGTAGRATMVPRDRSPLEVLDDPSVWQPIDLQVNETIVYFATEKGHKFASEWFGFRSAPRSPDP